MRGLVEVVQLGLKLHVEGQKSVSVDLNRIQAQQVAEALLEYAGVQQKSLGRLRRTVVPAFGDRSADSKMQSEPVVRLSRRKSSIVRV